jgi:hypothetical protein
MLAMMMTETQVLHGVGDDDVGDPGPPRRRGSPSPTFYCDILPGGRRRKCLEGKAARFFWRAWLKALAERLGWKAWLEGVAERRGVGTRSYVFWERIHLGFLEGKPSTLAPWGPVVGAEKAKARKPGFGGFRFFHWEGQSNHEKSLQ